MRWLQTEYVLKGLFLSLVLYAALQLGMRPPDNYSHALAQFNLPILAGLVLALVAATLIKLREGYRVKGRLAIFVFFLLLECSTLVYAGILGGAVYGTHLLHQTLGDIDPANDLLWKVLGGGALLGVAFMALRLIRRRLVRLAVILVLAGGLAAGLVYLLYQPAEDGTITNPLNVQDTTLFAIQLLLGLPFFYVLTFAGREEESEVEIGAICAILAVGLCILTLGRFPALRSVGVIVPVGIYLWYTTRILPALRVLKYVFRGFNHSRIGRHRQALQAFRRALTLDPKNNLAREGFWEVHRNLDLDHLSRDTQTLALVDLDLCLDRAGSLLIAGKPTPDQMSEAQRLLTLVVSQRPALQPSVRYWQAVAHTHTREYDQAAEALEQVIDPQHFGKANPQRLRILLPAWQLALTLHEEMRRRVGVPQLAQPGRRMDAIAAVERHLAEDPADQGAWGLKRLLYQDLTEAEYLAEVEEYPQEPLPDGSPPPRRFDHGYAQQLGLALIEDGARWERGGEYLRIAAHGIPAQGPSLFVQIAKAYQRNNNEQGALHNFELAKRAGWSVGAKQLAPSEAQTYFAVVKYLGEVAMARNDVNAAIENFTLYTASPASGIETLRTLAELYERKQDFLSAVRVTDLALVYNGKDKDLLDRKDRYYNEVMPDQLRDRLDSIRGSFDWDYCLTKARSILDGLYQDMEWLNWADHLVQLAMVNTPSSRPIMLLQARIRLRYGDREEALRLLEDIHDPKPEKFASNEDEDTWYVGCQLLGDMYMEIGRADLAVPCYTSFRESHRSGAKTVYKLGQAYEQLGDFVRAVKCYKLVTGYDGNPLVSDAYEALSRLKAPR
jgi:tetratricopeptide (TPR) repeat protein